MGIEEIDTPEFSKSGEHKLRILVHTVAPWIRSGYGNLCRHLTSRWKKAGFDPVVSCYYGCEPGGTLLINGVPCLPVERMGAPFGQDSYRHFYQTLKADIGILISDWWAFCLDEDTEILTRSGWKRHQEVEENEIVATFNMTTDLIEFQQIGGKFVYDNFKEVCSLKTKQLDLLVTPNHSLVYKCEKTLRTGGPWKKKEISNLRTSTIRYMPVSGKAKDLKPLGASQELMWLLGFIIAEGSFRDYDLRIYQSTKNESKLEKLRSSLKSLGIEFKEWVDERCREIKGYQTFPYIQFQIGAKYAKPLMARFSDPKKKIPREDILYCSDEEFQALLSGMVDGDGWKEKAGNGFQVMTKSERLRDFIQILCIFHGWRATFCQRENGCYLLTLSHNPYATFSGSHIKTESYSGKVWCVSTSNGTLIARRNGRHYIVGNSLIPDKNYSPRSAMYAPQDHVDYPEELVALTKRYDYVIALCKFQQDELAKNGIKAPVIEHGVETSVFAPMDKKKVREICNFSQDDFVMGIVAANSDKEPRKNFYGMFKAIRQFLDNNPDVKNIKVPYHGNAQDLRGIDLTRLAHNHNLDNILMFEDPRLSNVGLRDDEMAILYNNNDILLGASYREGFSLCHLESLSCGVPAIGTRFSAMPDLIGHNEERGWLADVAVLVQTPLLGYTSIPSVDSIERCIHRAYFHPEEIEKKGRLGREFALTLDWDRLVREKWVPFWSKVEDDIKPKPLSQRRLL